MEWVIRFQIILAIILAVAAFDFLIGPAIRRERQFGNETLEVKFRFWCVFSLCDHVENEKPDKVKLMFPQTLIRNGKNCLQTLCQFCP